MFAFGIQGDDRGITADGELLAEFFVLSFDLVGEGFSAWEIDFHEDEVGFGVRFEFWLGEDFFIELDAPAAPVGAREIEEDDFLVGFGFGEGFVVIIAPTCGGHCHSGGEGEDGEGSGDCLEECFHKLR